MGFCAWLGEKISNGWEKCKEFAADVKDKVCEGAKKVKEKVTNMWDTFTGKKAYKEAKERYEKLCQIYEEKKQEFKSCSKKYVKQIENHVNEINILKKVIKTELFPAFAIKMQKIKDIEVGSEFSIEEFKEFEFNISDKVRKKEELFKIDFDKHPIKSNFLAIVTFGFLTRKKAKESLQAVIDEENRLSEDMARMDAEIARLVQINSSLENVEYYFKTLVEVYEKLLVRLDNSINYLYVRCLSFAKKIVHQNLSIRNLPIMQQKEIEAIVICSKILKSMTDASILAQKTEKAYTKSVKDFENGIKSNFDEMNRVYDAA